ncbi:MAG TPA: hypothetical protein VK668_16680 [Mucilaginibacter sp.]|nr:hypothetical protein [Mucilaginibacter sp.]
MEFFKLFKKDADPIVTYREDKNGVELIDEGILFGGTNLFLKWGVDLDALVKQLPLKKERRTDRTIYRFGEQDILNGLTLDLACILWDAKSEGYPKLLDSIEFLSMYDKGAVDRLKIIASHLEAELGQPVEKELNGTDVSLKWKVKGTIASLIYLEKQSNKLHFEISKV